MKKIIDKNTTFRSERLSYRGMQECDAPLISLWRSDPENYACFFNQRPVSVEEHLTWFRSYLADSSKLSFMVLDEQGNAIGTAALSNISEKSCEISYMIGDKGSRRKGFGAEAIRALSRFAFDVLEVNEVYARIRLENTASIKTIQRAGFVETERVFGLSKESFSDEDR